jgi:hypothetical protein
VGTRDVIVKKGGGSMKYETPELHPLIAPIGAIQGTIDKAIQQIQESIVGDPREALSGYADWE